MKKFVYNSPHIKERRQELRNKLTVTEKILWNKLKKSQLGYKFIRQYSILNYIVDFYCPKLRIAIELDGEIHETLKQKEYDNFRQRYLESADIIFLRFTNDQIRNNMEVVLIEIISCFPS